MPIHNPAVARRRAPIKASTDFDFWGETVCAMGYLRDTNAMAPLKFQLPLSRTDFTEGRPGDMTFGGRKHRERNRGMVLAGLVATR